MKIEIFQMDVNHRLCFKSLETIIKERGEVSVNSPSLDYKKVFSKTFKSKSKSAKAAVETIYTQISERRHKSFEGRVLNTSDLVVVDNKNVFFINEYSIVQI